jgi:UDP-GlcNAc:undecaprenyl-phosphate/decaprenyl-phosphate GlcNAc-1-phosphate transferase
LLRLVELLGVAAGCCAASALLTWLIRNLARRRRWMAFPRVDRWHREPTALHGGIAIYVVFVIAVLATNPWNGPLLALVSLTSLMFVVGLVDDIRHLGAQTKLVSQLIAALLLYTCGYHFNDALPWWLDLSVVVFWVVALTNAINLLDNMNGLAAGIAIIAGAFRLLWFRETGNAEGATLSVVFIGSIAGFLLFNYPRASSFMGDAGSFTIGFALAALNLSNGQAYSKSLFSVLFFPVLVLAIPILDTAFVSVVRYFSGRAISQGGRDHVSHRLVAVGLSEVTAVLLLWSISTAAGAIAFVLYKVGFSYAWFGAALLMLGLLLFAIVLARVRVYDEEEVGHSPEAHRLSGFRLASEFRYKRQALWVLVDAATVALSVYGTYLLLFGGQADWPIRIVHFTQVAPVAVALVLAGLLAQGLYRTDWQQFSLREGFTIAVGTTIGLSATFALFGRLGDGLAVFVIALGATMLAIAGTRLFARALDLALRSSQKIEQDPHLRNGRYANEKI